MRIYEIVTEHSKWGRNWASYTIAARTCDEAIRKLKKEFIRCERVESIRILAEAKYQ